MNDQEILRWCSSLAPRIDEQRVIIRDLLGHASEDDMSMADRVVCLRAMELLTIH